MATVGKKILAQVNEGYELKLELQRMDNLRFQAINQYRS